jgi:hypothetical protein
MSYRKGLIFLCVLATSWAYAQEWEWDEEFAYYDYGIDDRDQGLVSSDCCGCYCETQEPLFNKFAIGPVVYQVNRIRVGGSRQSGTIYGFRARYDRIKPFGIYWGAEAWFGKGTLDGKVRETFRIKSDFTDRQAEGRLGFTFQSSDCHHPAFTPYLGYGFFEEVSKYRPPTAISLRFSNEYDYLAVGFLSSIEINDWLQVGINFKGRLMWEGGHCRVSDDPDFPDENLLIGNRFNYRLEFPVLYQDCGECQRFGFGVVPFFEYRHYGGKENYPHDFFDTRLRIYGAIFELTYQL